MKKIILLTAYLITFSLNASERYFYEEERKNCNEQPKSQALHNEHKSKNTNEQKPNNNFLETACRSSLYGIPGHLLGAYFLKPRLFQKSQLIKNPLFKMATSLVLLPLAQAALHKLGEKISKKIPLSATKCAALGINTTRALFSACDPLETPSFKCTFTIEPRSFNNPNLPYTAVFKTGFPHNALLYCSQNLMLALWHKILGIQWDIFDNKGQIEVG